MIIKNITVRNFQSYYDVQSLEFSAGLNLVIGNGGKGKSKLFNAFYWVLFGDIYITDIGWRATNGFPHNTKYAMRRHEFINRKALFETQIGNQVKTSVYLELQDDKGAIHAIERSVIATRLDNNDWISEESWDVEGNNLKVTYDTNMGTKVSTDILAENRINDLFPEGIRNYIWFQGESLDSLINFRNKETLKKAVQHISYYPYYEKLSDIISKSKIKIEKLESAKMRDNNNTNAAIKGLLANIDRLRNNIDNEEKEKAQLELNISKVQIAINETEGKMIGLANFTKLVSDYDKCNGEIKEIMNRLTALDDYQRSQVPSLWILRGVSSLVDKCKFIIKDHTEVQDTVPERKYLDNPGRSKLEEILKDEKCFVCGSDVSEGSGAHDWIVSRLKEQEGYLKEMEEYKGNMEFSKQFERFIGSIQDYPNTLTVSLSSIDKQYDESEEEIESLQAQKRKSLEKKKKLDEKIEEIKKKYGVNPVEQAQEGELFNNSIRGSRSILDREQRKFSACKEALSIFKSELKVAERDLEKAGEKTGSIKVSETEWKNISTFLEGICKRVQESARKDLLGKIQDRSNLFYLKFTEHDKGYRGEVKINDDYSIDFDSGLNMSHEDRKKMSIINAMLSLNQEALGTYYPFISDAPTSSFDSETTHNYLLGIKDIFGQSIIMTKDIDLDSDIYADLLNQTKVSRIFLLESKLYCADTHSPELHEVSTEIKQLK